MAVVLVVENGTGLATANSYTTLAEADAYLERHLYADAWTNADEDRRVSALVWATQLLDERMEWAGIPATTTQALCWPRDEAYDRLGIVVSTTVVPVPVKRATAELARSLLADNRPELSDRGGVVSQSVGPLSVTYGAGGSTRSTVPSTVYALLGPLVVQRMLMRA